MDLNDLINEYGIGSKNDKITKGKNNIKDVLDECTDNQKIIIILSQISKTLLSIDEKLDIIANNTKNNDIRRDFY